METKEKQGTLFLNMILSDEEPIDIVTRSINSVKDFVDGMYITITYKDTPPTTDAPLVKLLNDYKAHISYFKWLNDFSAARQYALDQIPKGKTIFIYWQDADDVLQNADKLSLIVSDMLRLNHSSVFLKYLYAVELDEQGDIREILIEHRRERILRNDGVWKWVGALHETLIEQQIENVNKVGRKECVVVHLSNNERTEKALNRNMEILEATIEKEKHKDPRTVMHLARVYFDKGKATEKEERTKWLNMALTLFHEFLEGTGDLGSKDYREPSGWREERAAAWDHVGEIAVIQNNLQVAIEVLKNAVDEGYEFPLYYVNLAWVYTMVKDYKRAKNLLNYATILPEPMTTVVMYPKELKTRLLQVSIEINMHERNLKFALEDAKKLQKFFPTDEEVKKTVLIIESLVDFNQACQSVMFLGKYLERADQKDKIPYLLKSLTPEMEQEKFASEMKHLYLPTRVWEKNEIAILCGPGVEQWSPKSVDRGIGGSEEAVIQMGKELTKLGWKITVYGHPLEEAGTYDGVEYKQWYDINTRDHFNILILWRGIGFIDINPKANFKMIWMHDIPNNPDFTKERVDKLDKIAVLSEYHKSLLRMNDDGKFVAIPDNKLLVTSNGIPPSTITHWKGNPKRLIYMSSPDRGLIYLLDYWPEIRRRVPDAELHVFYGFEVFDKLHQNNPAKMMWKKQILKMMEQKGITYHNRVSHKQLEKEINLSGIWAYPCNFEEISCISAMKAQAAGAVPVVTNYAALVETVKNGLKIDVDITTKEGQKDYINALTQLMQDPKKQEDIRKNMMTWAQDYYLWQHVAERWDKVLRVGLEDVSQKLIIKGGV